LSGGDAYFFLSIRATSLGIGDEPEIGRPFNSSDAVNPVTRSDSIALVMPSVNIMSEQLPLFF
jgi:hypothetical protein